VVNIASVCGLGNKSACPVYDGTKFFVVGYSLSISVRCKEHFVMIVKICEFHNILYQSNISVFQGTLPQDTVSQCL
jgi:hypothetical protein